MKIGVSSYSLAAMTRSGELDAFSLFEKATELGFHFVEVAEAAFPLPEGESWISIAPKLKAKAAACGLDPIPCFSVGADFLAGSGGDLDGEVTRVCALVDAAAAMGCAMMRHDISGGKIEGKPVLFESALSRLAEGIRKVTAYARTQGVMTLSENHGYFAQDSARMLQILREVGDENYAILCDIGNFMCADEVPEHAVGLIAPYSKHVHAKDFYFKPGNVNVGEGWFPTRGGNFLRGAIVGDGVVPVAQCLGVLKRAGYNGTVSIEFEGMEHPEKALKIGLKNLQSML